jgi:mannose-6-phosphate isomerase-like protein (cupin superfamily)
VARIIPAGSSDLFDFGGFGVKPKIEGSESAGNFSVVHHPLAARKLAAPLHRHHREDEYSFILRGRMGALLGEEVVIAEQGSWVLKPRGQWHTFWNPDETPCEIIEVISPAGFENYFRELAET